MESFWLVSIALVVIFLLLWITAKYNPKATWVTLLYHRFFGPRTDVSKMTRTEVVVSSGAHFVIGTLFLFIRLGLLHINQSLGRADNAPVIVLLFIFVFEIFGLLFLFNGLSLFIRWMLWSKLIHTSFELLALLLVMGMGAYLIRWSQTHLEIETTADRSGSVRALASFVRDERKPPLQEVSLWSSKNPFGRYASETVFRGRCPSPLSLDWWGERNLIVTCRQISEVSIKKGDFRNIQIRYREKEEPLADFMKGVAAETTDHLVSPEDSR